ncbi:MAG: M14 family metallopeptidase [Chloroflexota bacterium]
MCCPWGRLVLVLTITCGLIVHPFPTITFGANPAPSSAAPILSPTPDTWVYGRSAGGRDLVVWRFGDGPAAVALIGGLHGGLEWNTSELVEALRQWLLTGPHRLADGVRLLLVPTANPDGAAAGVGLDGRFNAHGADLDRAWETNWQQMAQHGPRVPDAGPAPFLEPEAAALHELLTAEAVRAVVLLHSFDTLCLHGGLFPAAGKTAASLAATLSQATGYPIAPPDADWPPHNRSTAWLAAQGIAAVDLHLPDRFTLDEAPNQAGLEALLHWAATPGSAPSPALHPTPHKTPWTAPSPIYGDLDTGYPLAAEGSRFTVHYQPGAAADGDTDYLIAATERALAHVNRTLGVEPAWHFDLYVAGTPFTEPGETSRGFSMSAARKVFYRYDGTGPLIEFEAGLAHELTHLTALNEFQPASSVMISEGLAVFVQWPIFESAGWLALDGFCVGMQAANALPPARFLLGENARYWGYMDQDNYMASGCLVAFLVQRWGMQAVAQLYHSADWQGVTGHSLAELDALWAEATTALAKNVQVDGAALAALEAEMGRAYGYQATHLPEVQGQPAGWALDGLRVTWRMGRFDRARAYADEFWTLVGAP